MPDVPLRLDRLSDWRLFGALMGQPLSHPENHPPWGADLLRVRLTAICEWAAAQPETGHSHPAMWHAWGYYWPLVPRAHRMYGWITSMHNLARWGLTQVDHGRLRYTTLIYHDLTLVCEHVSARLAEPLAQRGKQALEASSTGGQRKARVADRARASSQKTIWEQDRRPGTSAVAQRICMQWKPAAGEPIPAVRTVRRWIADLRPHP